MQETEESVNFSEPTPQEALAENALLLKRSFQKILTFVSTMTIAVLIVILRQGEKLFLFNIEPYYVNNTPLFQSFRFIMLGFLIYLLAYLLFFWNEYSRRKKMSPEEQVASLPAYRKRYNLFDLWTVVPVFLLGIVMVTAFFYSPAIVEGASMEPTYFNGDTVLIDHFSSQYESGDIVIVDIESVLLIKRLIATPGDRLRVDETGVYLNGDSEPIEEYIPMHYDPESDSYVPYFTYDGVLSEGQYFIMGDNRTNSMDGRMIGLVNADQMLGTVVLPQGD